MVWYSAVVVDPESISTAVRDSGLSVLLFCRGFMVTQQLLLLASLLSLLVLLLRSVLTWFLAVDEWCFGCAYRTVDSVGAVLFGGG